MIASTLTHRIVMRTSERAAFEAIRFLACDPEIIPAQETATVLRVEPFRGRYRISEEGKNHTEVVGLTALVDDLHFRVTSLSLQAKPHAGVFMPHCFGAEIAES